MTVYQKSDIYELDPENHKSDDLVCQLPRFRLSPFTISKTAYIMLTKLVYYVN